MQLFVGTYGFPVNQAACQTLRQAVVAPDARRIIRYLDRLVVRATIIGTGQSDLTNQEVQLRALLATPFQDIVLKQDAGSASGTALVNSQTLSGVTIRDGPHFRESQSPEYANQRTVEFTAEAETIVAGTEFFVFSFQERIEVQGTGGPRFLWRFPVTGSPVSQQVSENSPVITRQSGSAIGHGSYPVIPLPFAGTPDGIFQNDQQQTVYGSPKSFGLTWINYPVSWSYLYQSPFVLSGVPNLPPL